MARSTSRIHICLLAMVLGLSAACLGEATRNEGPGVSSQTEGNEPLPGTPGGSSLPGAPSVRLLTRDELRNTLTDVFGVTVSDADLPFGSLEKTLFASPSTQALSLSDLTTWAVVSESVGEQVVARRQTTSPCSEATGAVAECVKTLIAQEGRRAFRRPLSTVERTAYAALYSQESAARGHLAGLQLTMSSLLMSPYFLYRSEIGGVSDEKGRRRLDDFQYATALSFLITRSAPDERLLNAAESGALRTPEEREAQLRRLLNSPRGREGWVDFYTRWIGAEKFDSMEKDGTLFPQFNASFKASAQRELAQLIERDLLGTGGSFIKFLTSDQAYVDAHLAPIYGVSPAPSTPGFVTLDSRTRAGIFTRALFLASNSKVNDTHPIHMGFTLFNRVLCQPFPSPPLDALTTPYENDPALSRRQNFERRTGSGTCSGCHNALNPVSFTFDAYDPIGRHRSTLEGKVIDTAGKLLGTLDVDGPFAHVPELMQRLAASEQVTRCHVRTWLNYALGRAATAQDTESLNQTHQSFAEGGFDVVRLVAALINSEAFTTRFTAATGGPSPEPTEPSNPVEPPPPPTPTLLTVASVSASATDQGNVASLVNDKNLSTRWAGLGVGVTLTADLGSIRTLSYLKIAFPYGNGRKDLFKIQVSENGSTFTTVFTGASNSTTTQHQTFDIPDTSARHVRILGEGNLPTGSASNDGWNSISELEVFGL